MNPIKISEVCGIEADFILTDEFNYDFCPKIHAKLLEHSNDMIAWEANINNRINYRDYWDTMVKGPLTVKREVTLDVLEDIYSAIAVNRIVIYMRNKFKDRIWQPDMFFYYLEAALENNK